MLSEVEVLVEESIDERSAGFITQVAVRSAIYKQCTGGLVVRWVTTSESPLLYIFDYLFFLRRRMRDSGGEADWLRFANHESSDRGQCT